MLALLAALLSLALGTSALARDALPSFAPVLHDAEPAVVNVSTVSHAKGGAPDDARELMRRFFGGQQPGPQVQRSLGSGFVISADGDIVTNEHVVHGAERVRVLLATGEELDARVVGSDDKTDVALVHVDAHHSLPTLPLGDSDALAVGDWVLAIGNPFGLTQTATAGIVSAKGRFLGAGPYDDFIQTDASINPGNSGGPLLDQQGRVVGVNAAILAPAGGNVGIGFAIPIKIVQTVVRELHAHGRVVRGWLGVAVQAVTPDLAKSFGLEKPMGALVGEVTKGGPADQARIHPGDVIIRLGDHPIDTSRALPGLVAGMPPGTRIPATLIRDGHEQTVDVTIGRMPEERAAARERPEREATWGLAVAPVSREDARRLGIRPGTGLAVTAVEPGSPADDAGLEAGDVILEVDRRPVASAADLRRALGSADHVLLLVRRDSGSLYVPLQR